MLESLGGSPLCYYLSEMLQVSPFYLHLARASGIIAPALITLVCFTYPCSGGTTMALYLSIQIEVLNFNTSLILKACIVAIEIATKIKVIQCFG